MSALRIGVIGGSGLYDFEGLEPEEVRVDTPFGEPSDSYFVGSYEGVELVFLARHGRGHRFNPSEVNYRANIFGMKVLGVEWIVGVSAVGSLREEIAPGDVVVVDQYIDKTWRRASTFFEGGVVAHVAFGDPVCPVLRGMLLEAAREVAAGAGFRVHDGGTYVCMEGPAFSTRAESELHRSWGASVIGMTNMPEAKLAREAEISYASLAMVTDYDCWHPEHDDVTVEQVVGVLRQNAEHAQAIVRAVVPRIRAWEGPAPQTSALATALLTEPSAVPPERLRALAPLLSKYYELPGRSPDGAED